MTETEKRKWSAGICDFCGCREAKHSINGSLWFVCTPCMDKHYSLVPQVYAENIQEEVQRCRGMSVHCTPDHCRCGEEE